MSTLQSRVVALALMVLSASLASAGEHAYTYYDIGSFGCAGDDFTEATDLNDMGVVTGYSSTPDCTTAHAFTWFNGVMTDLDDTYEEGVFNGVEGISRTGVVQGSGDPDKVLALRLGEGVAFPLPVPPGCETQSNARGINDLGTIAVGSCDTNGSGVFAPAVYWIDDGTALALDLLPDLPFDATAEARDVNDAGVVLVRIMGGKARAYTWIDGEITEIPNLIGEAGIGVDAINNHNLIVGEAVGVGAMSYDLNTEVMTALGPGRAEAVNDRGSVVGIDIIDFSSTHIILYENGEVIDLFELILGDFLDTTHGPAINNYGWIVGWGDDEALDIMHGWLLVPIYDKGDFDGDGDVDLQDSGHFQRCFVAEPYIDHTLHVGCSVFDFDDDVDLDLTDYAAFQAAFTGPTAPNNNPNGPG